MKLDEWIELYEKKTKEKFEPHAGFKLFYLPDRGFCEIKVDSEKKIVMIYQACGDGKFWRDYGLLLADLTGCIVLGTICCRKNVRAFIKLFGFSVKKEIDLDNQVKRYICVDKFNKKRLLVSPVITDKKTIYYITMEV